MESNERIGVILVHGIGEQRRFEHLSGEARNLIGVLKANPTLRISVQTASTRDSQVLAAHETWLSEEQAPVRIDIQNVCGPKKGCHQALHIHEVWWADLDDKETLRNRVKFWFWALSMWGAKRFTKPRRPSAKKEAMTTPKFPEIRGGEFTRAAIARLRLFGFAVVFLLFATTINLVGFLLKRLRLGQLPADGVLYQYLGDIKLYQDRGRKYQGPLTDVGLPRRVAIRRRMVNTMVAVVREGYDRWYVLAHSLGTVVALNGLMETAHALPNYLPYSVWNELRGTNLFANYPCGNPSTNCMWPARPLWIEDDRQVLDRSALFSRLRGFITYGSPLDKCAYLWPQIANINNDKTVFPDDFEWINVFDHTDPVAGKLIAYDNAMGAEKSPNNLAYKAHPMLLLSHIRYLARKGKKIPPDLFAKRLLDWILDSNINFPEPRPGDQNWYKSDSLFVGFFRYRLWMWLALTGLLLTLIACVVNQFLVSTHGPIGTWYEWLLDTLWIGPMGIVLLSSGTLVLLMGSVRCLIESRIDRKRDAELARKKQTDNS